MDHYKSEFRMTETRRGGKKAASGNPDISELLDDLEKAIGEYRQFVQSLGTGFESSHVGQELQRSANDIKKKISFVKQQISSRKSRGKPSFEEKRLSDRLKGQCTTFDKLLKEARGKLELVMSSEGFIDGAEGAANSTNSANANGVGDNADQQLLTKQEDALRQREEEAEKITGLERDITDLKEIQTDLHNIVQDQGEEIDRIDVNVEKGAVRVEQGAKHAAVAVRLKRSNRKLTIIVVTLSVGIVAAILIILIIIITVLVAGSSDDTTPARALLD